MPTDEHHNLHFTLATEADVAVIRSTLHHAQKWIASLGIEQWKQPFSGRWITQKIKAQEFYLALLDNELVGVIRLLEIDPEFWPKGGTDALYVHSLAVRRAYAGQGLGLSMLHHAQLEARVRGKEFLRLDCAADNNRLCAFYTKAGFTPVDVRQMKSWKAQLFEKPVR